jgi:hypothetical protein
MMLTWRSSWQWLRMRFVLPRRAGSDPAVFCEMGREPSWFLKKISAGSAPTAVKIALTRSVSLA